MVMNLPDNAGDARDLGSIPGLGRSLGGGNGYPLQYFCLDNPMDRGAWWATALGVAKSQTPLSPHTRMYVFMSWMGEWMDQWIGGWMGGWMDGWMNGWLDERMDS